MSDEEKKAIDKINKLVEYLRKWNENVTVVPADIKYFEKILDMIKTYIRMIDENIEEILEQSKEIEELKNEIMEKELLIDGMKEDRRIAVEEIQEQYFISKDKIKEILEIEEKIDNEKLLSLLQTIVDENARLEDIEDRKVQIEYNNVFNKGVKSVEDKIKAKIEELEKEKNIPEEMDFKAFYRIKDLKNIEIAVLQSLLEKE